MKHLRFAILIACLLLVLASGAAAQSDAEESPLLDMLARVPALPANRAITLFTDFAAIETAYAPADRPADWAAFQAWNEAEDNAPEGSPANLPHLVWWTVLLRLSSGQSMQSLGLGDETLTAVGFELFEIDQELTYGLPPQDTEQYAGDFSLNAVRAAHEARGYTQEARDDAELWCGADGCDNGMMVDPINRNPANPFGGDLGRSQPLLIDEDALISSPSIDMVEGHIAVMQGERRSLAEAGEYQAAVNALTEGGVLVQALFLDGEMLLGMTGASPLEPLLMRGQVTAEQREAILRAYLEEYETLPQFSLLAMGDVVTETEQQGRLILIYGSREDAERAAEVLPARIEQYESLRFRRPLSEILAERCIEQVRYEVIEDDAANRAALVITFPTPKAAPEEIILFNNITLDPSGVPQKAFPGAVFRLFSEMVYAQDIGWLSTVPYSELEAQLND
jgi:hypothetical protein